MFGDLRWNGKRTANQEHRFNKWIKQFKFKENRLVIIEIGAGTEISTVRAMGESFAKRFKENVKLIRINPRDYEIENEIGFSIPLSGLNGIKTIIKEV